MLVAPWGQGPKSIRAWIVPAALSISMAPVNRSATQGRGNAPRKGASQADDFDGATWACDGIRRNERQHLPRAISNVFLKISDTCLWAWMYFGICFFALFVCFSSGPVKCRILQHCLAKLTHFTHVRQHPQHRFQPPNVRPTSLASPTNRGYQNRTSSWRVDGVEK